LGIGLPQMRTQGGAECGERGWGGSCCNDRPQHIYDDLDLGALQGHVLAGHLRELPNLPDVAVKLANTGGARRGEVLDKDELAKRLSQGEGLVDGKPARGVTFAPEHENPPEPAETVEPDQGEAPPPTAAAPPAAAAAAPPAAGQKKKKMTPMQRRRLAQRAQQRVGTEPWCTDDNEYFTDACKGPRTNCVRKLRHLAETRPAEEQEQILDTLQGCPAGKEEERLNELYQGLIRVEHLATFIDQLAAARFPKPPRIPWSGLDEEGQQVYWPLHIGTVSLALLCTPGMLPAPGSPGERTLLAVRQLKDPQADRKAAMQELRGMLEPHLTKVKDRTGEDCLRKTMEVFLQEAGREGMSAPSPVTASQCRACGRTGMTVLHRRGLALEAVTGDG